MILIESVLEQILDGGGVDYVDTKDQKGYHCGNMYHFGNTLYTTTPYIYK